VHLPVEPRLARQVVACLEDEGSQSKRLWALVGCEPVLVCKLFRMANSTFFAGLQKTTSVEEAVTRLGSGKAAQVVVQACRESEGCPQGLLLCRYMPGLWQHAQGCALGARWLANRCGYQGLADQVYLAGLLHDIGKHFLLAALGEAAACGDMGESPSAALVEEVLATMHIEEGLRLCEEWNLADTYKSVIAGHHDEELDQRHIAIALVKLANKGCRKLGLGLQWSPELVLPTTGEAQFLGIDEIALAELEIMLEDRFCAGKALPGGA